MLVNMQGMKGKKRILTSLNKPLSKDTAIRQIQTFIWGHLPALYLFTLLIVHGGVNLGLPCPGIPRITVGVVHKSLGKERWVDAAVRPSTNPIRNAK